MGVQATGAKLAADSRTKPAKFVLQYITTASGVWRMNNPGAGVMATSEPGAGATTMEPAKSIASPGEVGSRTGSPSHSVWSGVNGINHNPLVPKMVPAATRVASSGDQMAPCGKPFVVSVNPLICSNPVPSGYTSHKF